MKNRTLLSVVFVMLFALVLVGCDGLRKEEKKTQQSTDTVILTKGSQAPDFELVADDGIKLTLADLKGKKVYINVWGTWCPPCRMEMPELEEVYQEVKEKEDWVFLSVASPNDEGMGNNRTRDVSKKEILEEATNLGVTYPVYFEENHSFLTSYQVRSFPTHIFINSDGTIANYGIGALNKTVVSNTMEQVK
ncbi:MULTISPECIES: TlpA family protein disulfide reductase [Streptococcus]|uniref:TlpA family protein disulfide reductase n=1 Tax=Streptococcus caledonicus TaxID=2614158 RepID=A0ABW0UH80_9STRE|nr:TlpA family protein disulfide reductase [Streptococcus sp. S784/96/1]